MESFEGQIFNGRQGITQPPRIEENLTPDEPEDRIYKGWELKPHEFPWTCMVFTRDRGQQEGEEAGEADRRKYCKLSIGLGADRRKHCKLCGACEFLRLLVVSRE